MVLVLVVEVLRGRVLVIAWGSRKRWAVVVIRALLLLWLLIVIAVELVVVFVIIWSRMCWWSHVVAAWS